MTVYVCIYTHKHGIDVGVYRTEEGAYAVAQQLAAERVKQSWEDEEQRVEFQAAATPGDALDVFHDVERDYAYGETIEILARELGD
jgi:hypothetical protein